MKLTLPEGLKLGVAMSAAQTEGGALASTWEEWAARGKIRDGSAPGSAGGHYVRVFEDALLMKQMNVSCCRTGISWARVEPRRGEINFAALEHYQKELELYRQYGIEPILTLHHFDEPAWFAQEGGFLSEKGQADFVSFARRAVRAVMGSCDTFITINEPNIYAYNGYLYGLWPPGRHSPAAARAALAGMAQCHISSYLAIHELLPSAKVGMALHMRAFSPLNPCSLWQGRAADTYEKWFQDSVADAFLLGRPAFPVPSLNAPKGKYYDFVGLNYYTRSIIGDFRLSPKNRPVSDLKWDVYPEGLTALLRALYAKYQAPVMVAENGVCDNRDAFRSRYIYEHLSALCASLVPVTHYCHWSLIDNFEWLEGVSARFGLVYVDFDTQARTMKDSARFFADIIKNRGVTDEAYLRYVRRQEYPKDT